MLLHTVNKSPFERDAFKACLQHAKKGDSVLLIEDGIYAALKDTAVAAQIQQAMKNVTVYALTPDLEARGMKERVLDGVKLVDYAGFVDLTVQCKAVQAWL